MKTVIVFYLLTLSIGAYAHDSLFDHFPGKYKGNVNNTILGLGNWKKTGYLHVTKVPAKDGGKEMLELSTGSLTGFNLTIRTFADDLKPFFNNKETVFLDDEQIEEERVSFKEYISDNGLFSNWFGGTNTYAYQFKFREGKLFAFRVQKFHSSTPNRIDFFLEVGNMESTEPQISTAPRRPSPKKPACRYDWDF